MISYDDTTTEYDSVVHQYNGIANFLVSIGVSMSLSVKISKFLQRVLNLIISLSATLFNAIKIIIKVVKATITLTSSILKGIYKRITSTITLIPKIIKNLKKAFKSSFSLIFNNVSYSILKILNIKVLINLSGKVSKGFIKAFNVVLNLTPLRYLKRIKEIIAQISLSIFFSFKANFEKIKPRIINFINNLKPKNTIDKDKPKNTIDKDKPNIYK